MDRTGLVSMVLSTAAYSGGRRRVTAGSCGSRDIGVTARRGGRRNVLDGEQPPQWIEREVFCRALTTDECAGERTVSAWLSIRSHDWSDRSEYRAKQLCAIV